MTPRPAVSLAWFVVLQGIAGWVFWGTSADRPTWLVIIGYLSAFAAFGALIEFFRARGSAESAAGLKALGAVLLLVTVSLGLLVLVRSGAAPRRAEPTAGSDPSLPKSELARLFGVRDDPEVEAAFEALRRRLEDRLRAAGFDHPTEQASLLNILNGYTESEVEYLGTLGIDLASAVLIRERFVAGLDDSTREKIRESAIATRAALDVLKVFLHDRALFQMAPWLYEKNREGRDRAMQRARPRHQNTPREPTTYYYRRRPDGSVVIGNE